MSETKKLNNAKKVVDILGKVEKNTKVLLLSDQETEKNRKYLTSSLDDSNCTYKHIQIETAKSHGSELPEKIAEEMKLVDLVIGLTKGNITHTKARKDAQKVGVHVIALPESHLDNFFLANGWNCDFERTKPQIERLAQALTNADRARVHTQDGTDIEMSIKGRNGRALTGYGNSTDVSAGYCLESSLAPVEGTANGTIMVNTSVPGLCLIEEKNIEIKIKDGLATEINGGKEAEAFRNLLKSFNDEKVYNLGELGVGMNPECTVDGTMSSDESVFGAIQLALGTSLYIGGTVLAAAHYDTIVTNASLELDGKLVLKNTDLLI